MWIPPFSVEGDAVRLEPLEKRHAPGLFAAATPDLFTFTPQAPREWSVQGFEADVERLHGMADVVPFAVIDRNTGVVIGRTTFMDIRPQHRGLEIGRTWIARSHQGTRVNPEMKFLLLRHAFERLSPTAIRVQLVTGATNLLSQRAIAKLGAVREGTLRRDRVLPDGTVRDSVMFSIIAEEWPVVSQRLQERLRACVPTPGPR